MEGGSRTGKIGSRSIQHHGRFFNPEVLETGYKMSDSGTYSIPAAETREQFLEVIEQLPLVNSYLNFLVA